MKAIILPLINLILVGLFSVLIRKKGLLTYFTGGKVWLTWLAIAIITLMDELTSVFYAAAEAFRFIGPGAIVFIAFTSLFIHYMTTRLVEIAGILEHHGLIGGGVYSFSYLVLGPTHGARRTSRPDWRRRTLERTLFSRKKRSGHRCDQSGKL